MLLLVVVEEASEGVDRGEFRLGCVGEDKGFVVEVVCLSI